MRVHVGMTEPEVRAALGRRYAENLSLGDDFRMKRCCHEMYVGDMDWLGHRTTVAVYYDAAGKVASCESGELDANGCRGGSVSRSSPATENRRHFPSLLACLRTVSVLGQVEVVRQSRIKARPGFTGKAAGRSRLTARAHGGTPCDFRWGRTRSTACAAPTMTSACAISMLLADEVVGRAQANAWIAEKCRVTDGLVASVRVGKQSTNKR